MEQTALLELFQHPPDDGIELFEGQFALVLADDAAFRVDEHQRGPSPAAELVPDLEVPIVDDRVLDPVSQYSLAQVRGIALRRELRRVDADHDHPVPVLPLDLPQLRKDVHAIDSAEGPEIDEGQPPPQVGDV